MPLLHQKHRIPIYIGFTFGSGKILQETKKYSFIVARVRQLLRW